MTIQGKYKWKSVEEKRNLVFLALLCSILLDHVAATAGGSIAASARLRAAIVPASCHFDLLA